jgi:hypothetical protein
MDVSPLRTGAFVDDQFKPMEADDISVARNLNAAFLKELAGRAIPGADSARRYLKEMKSSGWEPAAGVFF